MTDQTSEGEKLPAGAARTPRNPVWSYDETVLLLDLYLKVGRAEADNPVVLETSRILQRLAADRGLSSAATFRNPQGVAMKLKAMAQQDPEWRRLGLKGLRPVRIDAVVWRDLAHDPVALAARRARIIGTTVEITPTVKLSVSPRSSHGPAPRFGWVGGDRQDGDALLYALKLEGPVGLLFEPGRMDRSMIVAKVGRTNDVRRRIVELSCGFPPTSLLGWRVMTTVTFAGAVEAHAAERRLLDEIDARRWSLGGEFLIAPEIELLQLIRESQNRAKLIP